MCIYALPGIEWPDLDPLSLIPKWGKNVGTQSVLFKIYILSGNDIICKKVESDLARKLNSLYIYHIILIYLSIDGNLDIPQVSDYIS